MHSAELFIHLNWHAVNIYLDILISFHVLTFDYYMKADAFQ